MNSRYRHTPLWSSGALEHAARCATAISALWRTAPACRRPPPAIRRTSGNCRGLRVMGNRARHRSSKQASSAGMKLYYKRHARSPPGKRRGHHARRRPCRSGPKALPCCACWSAGICNTDLELQRGYYGFVGTPGHEFVAEVVAADTPRPGRQPRSRRNQSGLRLLRLVPQRAGPPLPQPHRARHREAPRRLRRSSSPCRSATCTSCPTTFPPRRAVFLEPLAAACEILDQVSIPCGEQVAVLGDGKLGLLIALVLNAHGYRVHQFGRHAAKLRHRRRAPESRPKSPAAPAHRRVRLGGGRHRESGRAAHGRRDDPAPRHGDPEIDGSRHGAGRHRADHRE